MASAQDVFTLTPVPPEQLPLPDPFDDCDLELETPQVALIHTADGSLDISWDFVYMNWGGDASWTAEFKIFREVAGRETEVYSETVTGAADETIERVAGYLFGLENPIRGDYRAVLEVTLKCEDFLGVEEDLFAGSAIARSPVFTIPGVNGDGFLIGDVNLDGDVNFLDIGPFIRILSAGDYLFEADVNADGDVNFLDIGPFIRLLR